MRVRDGHSASAEHAAQAVKNGMRSIGFSDHAPLGDDISWTMDWAALDAYRSELQVLRAEYADRLQILCALETDWWPEREQCFDRCRPSSGDYLIGSVHFVSTSSGTLAVDSSARGFEQGLACAFDGDVRALCDAFFECERAAATSGRSSGSASDRRSRPGASIPAARLGGT